ncbi:MAG: tetratricopeptide repeat protein [Gammaproteobacteria bacterium]|nr:tetratricopeptide repeat protein [Gammaproteobacteria bacterium]
MKIGILALTAVLMAGAGCATVGGDKSARLNAELGREYLFRGDLPQAKAKIDRALEKAPDDAYVLSSYGLLLDQTDSVSEAVGYHKRAVEAEPQNIEYRNAYGASLCTLGKYDAAIAQFIAAAENKVNTKPEISLDNAALCALRGGQYAAAAGYAERALDLRPEFPLAQIHLAEARARTGNVDEAIDLINDYHRNDRAISPDSLYLAVGVSLAAGDNVAAETYKNLLLDRFPDSKPAKFIMRNDG